jgi:hypothetical protein
MAKPEKKSKKNKSALKSSVEQVNRRFVPASTTSTSLLMVLGGIGSLLIGAGLYAQFAREGAALYHAHAFWFLAAGAFLVSAALWFAASSDAVIRVGESGIAMERDAVELMPWYQISAVKWSETGESLTVRGMLDNGSKTEFIVRAKAHPQATPWIVREMRLRLPSLLEVPEGIDGKLDTARDNSGQIVREPRQLVGRKCAASGKGISYETDARVCLQCGRVYHKHEVPETCACEADLSELRDAVPS